LFANTNGEIYNYTYNADGIRTAKTMHDAGGDYAGTTEYIYDGTKLIAENRSGDWLYYFYDANGTVTGMYYNNVLYYFRKNLQGDITGIYNATGTLVVEYEYTPYGAIFAITDANGNDISTNATHIANINPFRYRGYYYDTETGFYYLITRYYDPVVGRFLNADSQLNNSLGILGLNQFSYCLNTPVNMVDYGGNKPGDLFDTMDEAARDAAEYLGELTWENTWEYSTAIYTVNKTIWTYRIVTRTYRIFGWKLTVKLLKPIKIKVTKYTYKAVKTDKKNNSVGVPDAPLFRKRVAALHTHPMGSWAGITRFSDADKKWADYHKIPLYVHGPNGELRKYDPLTGEDLLIYSDLPISPKTPWLD